MNNLLKSKEFGGVICLISYLLQTEAKVTIKGESCPLFGSLLSKSLDIGFVFESPYFAFGILTNFLINRCNTKAVLVQ